MNATTDPVPILHALLDGTLDANGEQAALDLLARDPAARAEFARLAQLQVWLSAPAAAAPAPPKPVVPRVFRPGSRKWWLAAAVAAALILFAASRLWPVPESAASIAFRQHVQPLLTACAKCHDCLDSLFTGSSTSGQVLMDNAHPSHGALWQRLSGQNACAASLDASGRAMLLQWIASSSTLPS